MRTAKVTDKALVTTLREIGTLDQVTPEAVIEAARSPSNPLHGMFDWDVKTAAHAHWMETARGLIRRARNVRYIKGRIRHTTPIPRYVMAPMKTNPREAQYFSIDKIKASPTLTTATLIKEMTAALGLLRRVEGIASYLGHNGLEFTKLRRAAEALKRKLEGKKKTA